MKKQLITILVLIILASSLNVSAEEKVSVAVAANFISAFKEIADDFEVKTGVAVDATFSSTGNLYNQIKNGVPYDVFLSTDEEWPARLQKDGLTEGTIIYARERVIIWSANKDFCRSATWQDALKNDQIKKIAIANPLTTPNGTAAKAAMLKAGLWDTLQSKLVNAEDVAQSFQYSSTGAVDASFCSLADAASPQGKSGCFFIIEEVPDIIQFACILKNAKNQINAELFASFLISDQTSKIKMKYGYR
jgi:molybdate transport system substrate-binding protein